MPVYILYCIIKNKYLKKKLKKNPYQLFSGLTIVIYARSKHARIF